MASYFIKYMIAISFLGVIISCNKPIEIVKPQYIPHSAHDSYSYAIEQLGLSKTFLGATWLQTAQSTHADAIEIKAPFKEQFIVTDTKVSAHSYRIKIRNGQKLSLNVNIIEGDTIGYFVDAFRLTQDSLNRLVHIASIDSLGHRMEFEVKKDGEYFVRFQPELLSRAKIELDIKVLPSLSFPVSGKNKKAIGSLFGVPREAGRRVHEGIDIFAKRHTPLVAVTDGYVQFAGVKEGSLGGTVVWLKDTLRQQSIYYAHLEEVFVDSADYVLEGDTIGSVGNSGNAITTYPHLHFGIYINGAVDPYPFVVDEQKSTLRMLAKVNLIGQVVRAKRNGSFLKGGLKRKYRNILSQDEYIKIIGCTGAYYKVENGNGDIGYVFYDNIETVTKPYRKNKLSELAVYDSSSSENIQVNYLATEKTIEYLARSNNMIYIRFDNGLFGWINDPEV